ncbi:hypothetical protein BV25DRAFT_1719237 [Artomyces pyxidatus]|uniref:Uncharacterized protein n=1 Tax=Artomyces pyxidatus TaxID=48021 RepID=A0ACB8SH53_9AGAM|nr:hypothetical protein BV25DRAFT_1719237 [Artomyces pyxidatus]
MRPRCRKAYLLCVPAGGACRMMPSSSTRQRIDGGLLSESALTKPDGAWRQRRRHPDTSALRHAISLAL